MMETTKHVTIFYFKAGAVYKLQGWSYKIKHRANRSSFDTSFFFNVDHLSIRNDSISHNQLIKSKQRHCKVLGKGKEWVIDKNFFSVN